MGDYENNDESGILGESIGIMDIPIKKCVITKVNKNVAANVDIMECNNMFFKTGL